MKISSSAVIGIPSLADGAQQALLIGLVIVLSVVGFALLFPQAGIGAIRVWLTSPTFNHCFLVLPMSLFLVWQRRFEIAGTVPAPRLSASAIVFVLSLICGIGSIAGTLELQQFAIVSMVQATLFGIFGAATYRSLAAPLLYLYFLVPSGTYLTPDLQEFTARFAVAGLRFLHIPVYATGAFIEIPSGSFAVAEACAGLRFLVAAVAFGVFFAIVTFRSYVRRCIFIVLSIVVPIIANGVRALALMAAAEWLGNPAAALADHIVYGWLFFSLVIILLVLIGQSFSDRGDDDPVSRLGRQAPVRFSSRSAVVAVACVLAAGIAPATLAALGPGVAVEIPGGPPRVGPPWKNVPVRSQWRPVIPNAARSYSQSFASGSRTIDMYVAFSGSQDPGDSVIHSSNSDADGRNWTFVSAENRFLKMGGLQVPVRRSVWLKGGQKRAVWSFYMVDGQVNANTALAKWGQLRAVVTGYSCPSAYVALSANVSGDIFMDTIADELLSAIQPLPSYLCVPHHSALIARKRK